VSSRFNCSVLVVDSIINEDGFLGIELILLEALVESVNLSGVVHELAVLYAFDGKEVGNRGENIIEIGFPDC